MDNMMVAVIKDDSLDYNTTAPYHPYVVYPEYPFTTFGANNKIYDAVRRSFFILRLDEHHYDTAQWNPLGEIIAQGDNVLLKPNLVIDQNIEGSEINHIITNGAIIRAVLDYVIIALKGQGNITIGDSPLQSCDFNAVIKASVLDKIVNYYNENTNVEVNILDFRTTCGYKDRI